MNRSRLLWGTIVILLITIAVHSPSLRSGFIWDDDDYVTENNTLTDPGGLYRIWTEPGATPQYYPLVFTSYWLEYRLWGLNPLGYHLVNILLHAAIAALLWALLRRLELPGAYLAAFVFALHPVHVESVAWITERKNVLSGLFYFLSLIVFLRYHPLSGGDRSSHAPWTVYLLSIALFVCALLSKTVTCSLPAVILLIFWWKHGSIGRRLAGLMTPFFALGIFFAFVTVWMERHHVGAQGSEWSLTLIDRVIVAGHSLWFYLGKLIVPVDLSFIYRRWETDGAAPLQLLYPVSFLLLLAALWFSRSKIGRGPTTALLIFAGTLVPALGFIDIYPMRYSFVADHFQYLASIAVIVLLISLATLGIRRLGSIQRGVTWSGSIVLLGILALLTWNRAAAFRDPESLWVDTVNKNPTSWMAHHNLAMIYEEESSGDRAALHYRRAIELRPDLSQSYFNLGTVLSKQRRWSEARSNFESAIDREPDYPDAHLHLGNVLFRQGHAVEAIESYREALRLDPGKLSAHKNLAHVSTEIGRWSDAVNHYKAALRIDPNDVRAIDRLARLLSSAPDPKVRDGADAVRLATLACRASGFKHCPHLATLAAAYAESGEFEKATDTITRAIDLARQTGDSGALRDLQADLRLYSAGQPSRLE